MRSLLLPIPLPSLRRRRQTQSLERSASDGARGVVVWAHLIDVALPKGRPVPFRLAELELSSGERTLVELQTPLAPGAPAEIAGRNRSGDLVARAA